MLPRPRRVNATVILAAAADRAPNQLANGLCPSVDSNWRSTIHIVPHMLPIKCQFTTRAADSRPPEHPLTKPIHRQAVAGEDLPAPLLGQAGREGAEGVVEVPVRIVGGKQQPVP